MLTTALDVANAWILQLVNNTTTSPFAREGRVTITDSFRSSSQAVWYVLDQCTEAEEVAGAGSE